MKLRGDKRVSKCRKSSAASAEPEREKLRNNAAAPECARFKTDKITSSHAKPKNKDGDSVCAGDLDDERIPRCRKSRANINVPSFVQLCEASEKLGCKKSKTNSRESK